MNMKCSNSWIEEAKKIGKDDPRKIIHSLKVGIALTLVSLFYYFNPVYEGFGVSAIWTVLTVVVVFEYSVGATIGRGLNRMLATVVGSGLGYGAHWIASHSGKIGEPVFIAIFVYIFAAIVTYVRFFPRMKAKYDYGLLVLILTFCMISVSGYRDDEVIHMAHRRVTTIIIGSVTCVLICALICPVWIGQDLHNFTAANLDNLGNFLLGFGSQYFRTCEDLKTDKSFLEAYRTILTSKNTEETMANLAKWEPRHGGFKWRHPWELYLKLGSLSRECAYKIQALNGYLDTSNKTQTNHKIRSRIEEQCRIICSETGKALKELGSTIKRMKKCALTVDSHMSKAKEAARKLGSQLKTELLIEETEGASVLEVIAVGTVGSILIDVTECVENIAKYVEQLAIEAEFSEQKTPASVQPVSDEVVIDVAALQNNANSSAPE